MYVGMQVHENRKPVEILSVQRSSSQHEGGAPSRPGADRKEGREKARVEQRGNQS